MLRSETLTHYNFQDREEREGESRRKKRQGGERESRRRKDRMILSLIINRTQ